MQESDRQRAIRMRLARSARDREGSFIPTGFAPLDAALGGGWPRGRIVEIFGPVSSGKSTLALQSVIHLQQNGGVAAWVDADRTFDATYAATLGIDLQMPILQPDSAEEALDIACQLVKSGGIDLLMVDSAAALVPQLELDAAIGEAGHDLYSSALAAGLRRLAPIAAKAGVCAVFLNQMRNTRIESGVSAGTSAGGAPLKLHAAVRLALEKSGSSRIRVRTLKNKAAEAFSGGELQWRSGTGFVKSP